MEDALRIEDNQVVGIRTSPDEQPHSSYVGGTRTQEHDLRSPQFPVSKFERVEERGQDDPGSALLVVVPDGDSHFGLQRVEDLEALG